MVHPPLLRSRAIGGGVRLELGTWSYGNGSDLASAADDLIARLATLARGMRSGQYRLVPELGMPEREYLDFLWELSAVADRPEDIRRRVFG